MLSTVFVLLLNLIAKASIIGLGGEASGGILRLHFNNESITITTEPKESAAEVIEKIESALKNESVFMSTQSSKEKEPLIFVQDDKLYLKDTPNYALFFSGTEHGLNLPAPAFHATTIYDGSSSTTKIYWSSRNSANRVLIDGLCVFQNANYEQSGELTLDINPNDWEYLGPHRTAPITLKVYNSDFIYSNMQTMFFSRCSMSDAIMIDTWRDLICNWAPWSEGYEAKDANANSVLDSLSTICLKTGKNEDEKHPLGIHQCRGNQGLSLTSDNRLQFGIYRKFLGLTPGHTYRIHARLNTFEGTPEMENWAFTMHACYNEPGNNQLTTEQFMGDSPLPDGSKGKQAGLMAEYGTGKAVTNSQWEHFSTGNPQCPDCIGDITLPAGSDTITTWLRLEGKADLEVGFDWIMLEDLTCMQENGIEPSALNK